MKTPTCLIVTVNYNTASLCQHLINSICEHVLPTSHIRMMIVDNDSKDDSFEQLQAFIDANNIEFVELVKNVNNGFAGGNNAGIRHALRQKIHFDRIWFLNPDTVVQQNTYRALTDVLMDEGADCAGSQLLNIHGEFQPSYFNFPNLITEISSGSRFGLFDKIFRPLLLKRQHTTDVSKCDWVSGASFMITAQFFIQVGFMDEKYFLYFEEIDYFYQAKQQGLVICHVPRSKITHIEGASTNIHGAESARPPRRAKYWFDSRRRYFLKNYGKASLIIYDTCFIAGYSLWLLRTFITKRDNIKKEPEYFLRDFIRNSVFIRGVY